MEEMNEILICIRFIQRYHYFGAEHSIAARGCTEGISLLRNLWSAGGGWREGTVEAVIDATGGTMRKVLVSGPLWEKIRGILWCIS